MEQHLITALIGLRLIMMTLRTGITASIIVATNQGKPLIVSLVFSQLFSITGRNAHRGADIQHSVKNILGYHTTQGIDVLYVTSM